MVLPMTRRDIADYLGMTLEAVSRSLCVTGLSWLSEPLQSDPDCARLHSEERCSQRAHDRPTAIQMGLGGERWFVANPTLTRFPTCHADRKKNQIASSAATIRPAISISVCWASFEPASASTKTTSAIIAPKTTGPIWVLPRQVLAPRRWRETANLKAGGHISNTTPNPIAAIGRCA